MSMENELINILGNIINDTWGKAYNSTSSEYKVSAQIVSENKLKVTCFAITNLLNRQHMHQETKKSYDQLDKACNEYVKSIKSDFKLRAGRALKIKELSKDHSAELTNYNPHNPKGTALIRCVYYFEIK